MVAIGGHRVRLGVIGLVIDSLNICHMLCWKSEWLLIQYFKLEHDVKNNRNFLFPLSSFEHCHAISVGCKMLKISLNQEKPKTNEAVYLLRTVLYCTETKYCLLLLRTARMETDSQTSSAMAKNVLWMTFPAKRSNDFFLLHIKDCFGISKGH